jgi:hypothetical protein
MIGQDIKVVITPEHMFKVEERLAVVSTDMKNTYRRPKLNLPR